MTTPLSTQNRTALLFTDGNKDTHLGGKPLCVLPQMGKSMLQRTVEQCVQAGCKTIWIISSAHQHDIEEHLESGARWGCQINYLITHPADHHALSHHIDISDEMEYLIGFANVFVPNLNDLLNQQHHALICDDNNQQWLGWANVSGQWFHHHPSAPDFAAFEARLMIDPTLRKVAVKDVLSLRTADDFYQNISALLAVAGNTQHFGYHLKQHRTAEISAPVYIGNDVTICKCTQIGPNVIIEDGCYIDTETTLSHCYIAANTYVGKNIDVMHKLVVATTIYDAKLECLNTIQDPWIISTTSNHSKQQTLQEPQKSGWFAQLCQPIFKYFHVNNH